jgi:hypothetical protein
MPRGKHTRADKQDIFRQICSQLEVPIEKSWLSTGGTVIAKGFEAVLEQVARNTGIPPTYFDGCETLVSRLIHKSIEGMVLALEVINKPSIGYRLEAFLFLFINAWELLFKAKIVADRKATAAIADASNPDRTITFDRALKTVLTSDSNPIRKNLARIEELRNNAAHMFIDIVPPNVLLVCQAGILNYEKSLQAWFARSLCDRIPCGMIFLVSELDPQAFSLESPALTKRLPPESISYLRQWQQNTRADIESLPDDQVGQYAVDISLNLSLVNNQSKADIIAAFDPQAGDSAAVAIKYQRLIDKYPFSYKTLVAHIKQRRPGTRHTEINAIINRRGIKGNQEYSGYNFRNMEHEERYAQTKVLPTGTPILYNKKAADYILQQLGSATASSPSSAQQPSATVPPQSERPQG